MLYFSIKCINHSGHHSAANLCGTEEAPSTGTQRDCTIKAKKALGETITAKRGRLVSPPSQSHESFID